MQVYYIKLLKQFMNCTNFTWPTFSVLSNCQDGLFASILIVYSNAGILECDKILEVITSTAGVSYFCACFISKQNTSVFISALSEN